MSFPVNSTSLETTRIARALLVVKRRTKASAVVASAGVYNCRTTTGTDLLSAHAFGDAADLMFKPGTPGAERDRLARAIIRDATEKTVVNMGRPTKVNFVIWNDGKRNLQWTRSGGVEPYSGADHSGHIHLAGSFSVKEPAGFECGDRLPGVKYQ